MSIKASDFSLEYLTYRDMLNEPPPVAAAWRRFACDRGGLLRARLERGVEWSELAPLVEGLSVVKRGLLSAYGRKARPMVIRIEGQKP